jgi:hypothetical protein
MADNVPITPGSGITIRTDDVGGVQYQYVKLDVGGDGVSKPVIQGGSDGLPVDLLSSPTTGIYIRPAAGQTFPVSIAGTVAISAASALAVSALVTAPVFVRLSDGTNPIATLPVSGTVTANQGSAAAAASAWFQKITDGTDTVGISTVGGAKALKVDVIQSVTGATNQTDSATFTAATTGVVPIAGVYDDSVAAPTAGQLAGVRINAARGLHVNLRAAAGTEIGSASAPLRVDPTGTTAQPVKLKDASGNAFSDANPLPTLASVSGRTRVTKSVSLTASQTAAAIWTPTTGKAFYVTDIEILISVTGNLTLFDNTNAAANIIVDGVTGAWTVGRHSFHFEAWPWASAAINNVLKYTSGTGLTAVLTVHGFEL